DPATVARLAGRLTALLAAGMAAPEVPLADLDLLSGAERHQLVREWNDTARAAAGGACLHRLIEAQVERTPDAPAVRYGEEERSYRELDREANRLAHFLIGLGVRPETRVPVFMERSIEMVVSLLAVLKAGGAYVPLDPDLPAERLAFMVEEAAGGGGAAV